MFGFLRPKSIWAVHNPKKRPRLCHKINCECCPPLGRKVTYDIVKKIGETDDGGVKDIIMQGVSEADAKAEDVTQRVKRVGAPTIQYHPLGVVAAFRSKKKAMRYMDEYFKTNQDQSPDSLELSEIKLTA